MKSTTLHNKNFIFIVIGQIISLFGNGILRFSLPFYLLQLTGSSALFGIVSAVSFLPLIVLMPIGGILADRGNKRMIMVILDFITGLIMLFFYLWMDNVSLIPLLLVTMMALYSISGLYMPTVQASIPMLLDSAILAKGNGIVSSIGGLSTLLSPIIGGILLGSYGITPIILVSIVCFFLSAVLELFICIPPTTISRNTTTLTMVKEDTIVSIHFIFKEKPTLKKLIYVTCLLNAFVSAMIMIALPVLITERLSLSEEFYGVSQAVLALGGLFGGILIGVLGAKLTINHIHCYLCLLSVSITPISIAMLLPNVPMVSFGLILFGSFSVMCLATIVSVLIITYIQSQTMEHMVGKVMAFLMTMAMAASPLGQAFYGLAFECLLGYESILVLASAAISLLIAFYAKQIFRYALN